MSRDKSITFSSHVQIQPLNRRPYRKNSQNLPIRVKGYFLYRFFIPFITTKHDSSRFKNTHRFSVRPRENLSKVSPAIMTPFSAQNPPFSLGNFLTSSLLWLKWRPSLSGSRLINAKLKFEGPFLFPSLDFFQEKNGLCAIVRVVRRYN